MKAFQSNLRAGILGGGQLGRMLAQEAINLNISFAILDPDPEAPCKHLSANFVVGSLTDFNTVYNFGKGLDLITIEIEKVNADALEKLESEGVSVYPQPAVIRLIQDKGLQKEFFVKNDIPTSPFRLFDSKAELQQAGLSYPFIQKLRKDGYDGKGVLKIDGPEDLHRAFNAPSLTEELIDFEKELSVIVARNTAGEMKAFPCVDMEFNPEANLVEFLISPSSFSVAIQEKATQLALRVAESLNITGLLAVELFLTRDGQVLVNEIAPRPHNSGHQSIEGNYTSQFNQHLRAILGLPLGNTTCIEHAVMINLLGEPGFEGPAVYEGLAEILGLDGVYVHLYGKKITHPFRKMGHVTVLGKDRQRVIDIARFVQRTLKIKS